jgi:hypothetical protein
MAVTLLFVLMLLVTLMRVYLPKGTRRTGKDLKTVRLSLVERFLLHRVNLYAVGAVLLMMTLTHSISSQGQFIVLLLTQLIVFIPAKYSFTSTGVGLNNVVFRPWGEFKGFTLSSRRVTLVGREGTRALTIPLLSEHQKEVVPALRRHLTELTHREEARPGKRVTTAG